MIILIELLLLWKLLSWSLALVVDPLNFGLLSVRFIV